MPDAPPARLPVDAYYVSWVSRWREKVRASAQRQRGCTWTTITLLEVDGIGDRERDLWAAVIEDHTGETPDPALVDQFLALPARGLRITPDELDRRLASMPPSLF